MSHNPYKATLKVDNDNQNIVAINKALELVNQTLERLEKSVTNLQQEIHFLYEKQENREINKCQEILETFLSKIDHENSPMLIELKHQSQEILLEILKLKDQLGSPSLSTRYKNPFTPWTPE